MRTPARSAQVWIGAVLGAACLLLPLSARPQTAETFKGRGAVPYTEYLRRTGETAPKPRAKPKIVKPKSAAAKSAPVTGQPARASAAPSPVPRPNSAPALAAAPKPATAPQATAPTPAPAPAPAPAHPALPTAAPLPSAPVSATARLLASATIPAADLEAFVDGSVRQAMGGDHIAGAAVVVVQDGQVVLQKGYGLARLSPAAPVDPQRTLFRLGPVSKVLTWIEVLKQVDAGRLSLTAPIDDALPPDMKLGLEGFSQPVRLQNLMTHSAGFETRDLGRLYKTDPRRLQGLGGAIKRERSRRVREAGRLTSYSDYGAALAGAAAAAVAKAPFDRLMEDDLLKPAGLFSTTFREPYPADPTLPEPMGEEMAARMSDGFREQRGGLTREAFAYGQDFGPAVSASATPGDMGRLMTLLLAQPGTGGAPWGQRVTAALFTPAPSPTPGPPAWTDGLRQETLPGGFLGFGEGGGAPSFRSRMLLTPQLRLGVFVTVNSSGGDALAQRLPQAVVARFYGPPPPIIGRPDPAIDAARYAGLFLTTRRAYHGLEGLVDRLTHSERVYVDADGRLVIQDARGGGRAFAPDGADRFVSVGGSEQIAFIGDAKRPEARPRLLIDPSRAEGAVREDWIHSPSTLLGATIAAVGAAGLCLGGLLVRDWRDTRQTRGQSLASSVQAVAAGVWLIAVAAFLMFRRGATSDAALMVHWPSLWLIGASWAALAAALLCLVQLVQLRDVWSDKRRVQGWSGGRRFAHTTTTLVFLAYALILAPWGALEPWSS